MCLRRQREDVQGGLETPGHLLPRPLMEQHPQVTQLYDTMGHCSTLAARAGEGQEPGREREVVSGAWARSKTGI